MTELETKIKNAAQKYYEDGSSDLTDAEFDALVDQLRREDPDSPLLHTPGWGYSVSEDSTAGKRVKHKYGIVGSLEKVHSLEEALKLSKLKHNSVLFCDASLKLDGLSVVLYFNNGRFYQALTRGENGLGIDITHKILKLYYYRGVDQLDLKGWLSHATCAIRGEILMQPDVFEEYKKEHPEAKNPRNSAAGIINGKSTDDDLKYLDVVVYTIIGGALNFENLAISDVRNLLSSCTSFKVVPYTNLVVDDVNEDKFFSIMQDLRDKWYNLYPADGIVLTAPELHYMKNDEAVLYEAAVIYDAVAFKFKSEEKKAIADHVEWTMSKTHYAVPVVHIQPVELAGTTVRKCTGFNAQFIINNKIGRGSEVLIEKRGEIIPVINEVVTSTSADSITTCPICGSTLEWAGVHLVCNNPCCGNAKLQDLIVWIDNIAPVDGLGDSLRIKYLSEMFPDLSVESVMDYKKKANRMYAPGGHMALVAEMFNKLYNFDKSTLSLPKALLALNIPRVGGLTAIKIAETSSEEIRKCLAEARGFGDLCEKISKVTGPATALSVCQNREKFLRLHYISDRIKWAPNTSTVRGKVAITGKLSVRRADFEAQLKGAGFYVGNITKDTNYLITDDPTSSSEKNRKADQWGIVKLTEEEFRSKFL